MRRVMSEVSRGVGMTVVWFRHLFTYIAYIPLTIYIYGFITYTVAILSLCTYEDLIYVCIYVCIYLYVSAWLYLCVCVCVCECECVCQS